MNSRVFVDTGAWFAYANRRDPDHARVAAVLRTPGIKFVTSNFVFDETVTLCLARVGHGLAVRAGEVLRNPKAADLMRLAAAEEEAAWELFTKRPDKEYSLTDCTSFVLMKKLGLETAVALDEHFKQEGFQVLP